MDGADEEEEAIWGEERGTGKRRHWGEEEVRRWGHRYSLADGERGMRRDSGTEKRM